jgi:hypothetical protein
VGRTLAPAIEDEQLMPDQHGFGDYATQSPLPSQSNHCDNEMDQEYEHVAHFGNSTKIRALQPGLFYNSP